MDNLLAASGRPDVGDSDENFGNSLPAKPRRSSIEFMLNPSEDATLTLARRQRAPTITIDTTAVNPSPTSNPDANGHPKPVTDTPASQRSPTDPTSSSHKRSQGFLAVPNTQRSRQFSVDSTDDTRYAAFSQRDACIGGSSGREKSASPPLVTGSENDQIMISSDALKPDQGKESDFQVGNNPFALSPDTLSKIFPRKVLSAMYKRGGSVSFLGQSAWSPSKRSLRGVMCYEAPGTINGVPVNALPDTGSSVDAISEDFAKLHGLRIRATDTRSIRLIGGHVAESVGRIVGDFTFQGEKHGYRREFHVLRNSVCELVLGRKFLDQTKTLTEFCRRIVKRVRPCVQKGNRLFLLDEFPKDRLRCTVNGSEASAVADTGSDLMLVSGDYARRNKLQVRRGERYRREVELIDGSTILTDGMALNAKLELDSPPKSSHELDYGQYLDFTAVLSSYLSPGANPAAKATFICDLHVIENLPCDIILSNEFIFENQVFSRFKHLFYTNPASIASGSDVVQDDSLWFIRNKGTRFRFFSWRRETTQNQTDTIPLQAGPSWEEVWEIEEARRNRALLRISFLPQPQKSVERRNENHRQALWDRDNPRPPESRPGESHPSLRRTPVPGIPSRGVFRSTDSSTTVTSSMTSESNGEGSSSRPRSSRGGYLASWQNAVDLEENGEGRPPRLGSLVNFIAGCRAE